MNDWRISRWLSICLLVLFSSLIFSLNYSVASAQTPDEEPRVSNPIPFLPNDAPPGSKQPVEPDASNPILFLPLISDMSASDAAQPESDLEASRKRPIPAVKMLVDTDPGIDDAVALSWLFSQHEQPLHILGVVTVAGNTTLHNATNNALLVLEKLGRRDVPVIMGAAAPLVQPLSKTSWFIHGPDGLWFLGAQNPRDLSHIPNNAPAFYCQTVGANPGLNLLALGPLTNIAQAVQQCPDTMKLLGKLTILGGAKFGGNQTPVAEFNFWQDPEAASIVLNAGLPITLVLLDAFTDPTIVQKDLDKLFAKGIPAVQFLAPAIQQYAAVQITNTGRAGIPDAVAAVIALNANKGERQPALVKLVLEQSMARGQSIVGLSFGERITMLSSDAELSALAERAFAYPPDPSFDLQMEFFAILMREPDNAQAVTAAPANLLTKTVFPDLMAK